MKFLEDIHQQVDAIVAGVDVERPRATSPWKRTAEAINGELAALKDDPSFGAALDGTCILATAESPLLSTAIVELVALAERKAPNATHVMGPSGLGEWCLLQCCAAIQVHASTWSPWRLLEAEPL